MPILPVISDSQRKERLDDIKQQIQTACPALKVTEITEHFLGAFVIKVEIRGQDQMRFHAVDAEESDRGLQSFG